MRATQLQNEIKALQARRAELDSPKKSESLSGVPYLKKEASRLASIPGKVLDALPYVAEGAIKNPKQALAGIGTGIASIADLPSLAYNFGAYFPEKYSAYKYGEENVVPTNAPYYAHDAASKLADTLVGKPKNQSEQFGRLGGELSSIAINPLSAQKAVPQLANIGKLALKPIAPTINTQKYEAIKELGLKPRLGEVSDSKFIKSAEKLSSNLPFGVQPFEDANKLRKTQVNDLLNSYMPEGSKLSALESGSQIKSGAKAYNSKVLDVSKKLYEKAYNKLPPHTSINVKNTAKKIDETLNALTPQARKLLETSPAGKKLTKLRKTINENFDTLPIDDVRNVYKNDLNDFVKDVSIVGTKDEGRIKQVVDTLNQDVRNSLKESNPNALKELDKADKFWAKFSKEARPTANKFAGKKTSEIDAFDAAKNALKKGNDRALHIVTSRMKPAEKEAFSSTMLNELGNKDGKFSPKSWAQEYLKLPPQSQKAIAVGLPKESGEKLKSIASTLTELSESKLIPKSNSNLYSTASLGLIGSGITGLLSHGLVAGSANYGFARAANSGKFIDALYNISKAKTGEEIIKALPALSRAAAQANIVVDGLDELAPEQNNNHDQIRSEIESLKKRKEELEFNKLLEDESQNEFIDKIAQVESGGNPNARSKTSSASGLLQFTNSTWKEGVNRYGEEEGVSLRDKNNPDAQRKIANRLLSDNSKELEKFLGRKPKDAEIYMTHFLGLGGTKKLLKSNDKRVAAHIFPVEARANRNVFYKNGRPITIAELKSKINQMIS